MFDEAVRLDNQEKYHEAIIVWNKLIRHNPAYLPAYINRGADKFALKQYAEAIKDYCYVINRDSTYITAWVNRGCAKSELNDYKSAIDDFNAAERIKHEVYGYAQVIFYDKINPNDVPLEEICLQRGIAYWYADSLNKAYSDLNYCIDREYEVVCSYFWRAYVYWKAGKEKEAHNDFMTVISQGRADEDYVIQARQNLKILDKDSILLK
ncbi:MAG: hypothetical protein LIP00_00345 [Parabacteroides sp.]|nr:hypothetical protein [Parabacteroides sp.]